MIDKEQMKNILEDYAPDDDIFSEEDEKINKLKHIIYDELDEVDKRVLLMYAELGTLEKVGKELGVSRASSCIRIKQIRQQIFDKLGNKK